VVSNIGLMALNYYHRACSCFLFPQTTFYLAEALFKINRVVTKKVQLKTRHRSSQLYCVEKHKQQVNYY